MAADRSRRKNSVTSANVLPEGLVGYIDVVTREVLTLREAVEKWPAYKDGSPKRGTYRCDLPHTFPRFRGKYGLVNIKYRAARDTHHSNNCQRKGSCAGRNTPRTKRRTHTSELEVGAPIAKGVGHSAVAKEDDSALGPLAFRCTDQFAGLPLDSPDLLGTFTARDLEEHKQTATMHALHEELVQQPTSHLSPLLIPSEIPQQKPDDTLTTMPAPVLEPADVQLLRTHANDPPASQPPPALESAAQLLATRVSAPAAKQPPPSVAASSLASAGLTAARPPVPPAPGAQPFSIPLLMQLVRRWDVPIHALKVTVMAELTVKLFEDLGLLDAFMIPPEKLKELASAVFNSSTAPYHNASKVFATLHACWIFLSRLKQGVPLSNLHKLGAMLAALGQNFGHVGLTSNMLSKLPSYILQPYSHLPSPLEQFHSAKFFELLRSPSYFILEKLNVDQLQRLQDIIHGAICATDLSKQKELLTRFLQATETNQAFAQTFAASWIPDFLRVAMGSVGSEELQNTMVAVLVHCADQSDVLRSWPVFRHLNTNKMAELYQQLQYEKDVGLGPSEETACSISWSTQCEHELKVAESCTKPAVVVLSKMVDGVEREISALKDNLKHLVLSFASKVLVNPPPVQ